MPIDPTIVTGLAPQAPSAAMIQAAEAQRAAQEKRREEAELRQILASAPDDETAIALLNRSGKVDYATKLRDQLDKHRQSVDQTYLNDLKKDEAETGLLVKVAQGVTNQSTLDAARQLFSSYSPEGQQLAQQLPQTWDDTAAERMQQFVQMGLTAEQHSKAQQDSYDKLMSGDWDRGTAELLATADTPDEAQGVLAMLQARKAPKAILDRFAPLVQQWSPETRQHVADMALSEKDRRDLAEKAAERQAQAASRAANDQRMAATAAETARHNRAMEARPVGGAAGAGASGTDAKAIADAIAKGDQPPTLTGLYRFAAPVRAELARQGYDLTRATEDWNATSKYLSTLNGAQQTRLRQAINFTQESVPLIRQLVTEWDSAGLPLLSKTNLEAAASGAYGQTQQSLARRLKGQIADLTSELGTVYKGGNSSTDESLRLAAENLQADWSKKAALDALTQIEKNLQFRANSIKNVGPVGGREQNPYAPESTTSGGGAIAEGTERPVPGHPGVVAVYRGGRWIVK